MRLVAPQTEAAALTVELQLESSTFMCCDPGQIEKIDDKFDRRAIAYDEIEPERPLCAIDLRVAKTRLLTGSDHVKVALPEARLDFRILLQLVCERVGNRRVNRLKHGQLTLSFCHTQS